jgi:predicted protein tyrosine phosphatase
MLACLRRGEHVKKVLFVCTANICRSLMAQVIFDALAEDGNLPFRAEGAGTAALEGRTIAPNALAALDEAMIEGADLVLAMTPQHAATMRRMGGIRRAGSMRCRSTRWAFRGGGSRILTGSPWRPTGAPCVNSTSTWSAWSGVSEARSAPLCGGFVRERSDRLTSEEARAAVRPAPEIGPPPNVYANGELGATTGGEDRMGVPTRHVGPAQGHPVRPTSWAGLARTFSYALSNC